MLKAFLNFLWENIFNPFNGKDLGAVHDPQKE